MSHFTPRFFCRVILLCVSTDFVIGVAVADEPIVVRQRLPMETLIVRLRPGDDVYARLQQIAKDEQIDAGCVLACVGSMRKVALRFANQPRARVLDGKFEIVSLSGTLSRNRSHLHASVSDGQGRTTGGHLMPGGEVFTTVEITIGILPQLNFVRALDPESGYPELVIRKRDEP
jgi:hypothetical protein